jgi:hypothetical protein
MAPIIRSDYFVSILLLLTWEMRLILDTPIQLFSPDNYQRGASYEIRD